MKVQKQLGKISVSLLMLLCVLLAAIPMSASAAPAGQGTKADPYRITTAQELDAIRNNLSAHYKLANTIDMSALSGFKPIGTLAKPFSGSLTCDLGSNGLPLYAIKNVKVQVAQTKYAAQNVNRWEAGLFGATKNASLKGILVLGASITSEVAGGNSGSPVYGNYNPGMDEMGTGILIGIADGTTVTNCGVSGTITSKSNHSGGLVGRALSSTFSKCYADTQITTTGFWCEGGFVGSAVGSDFSECFSEGTANFKATADSDHTSGGGFVGSLEGGMVNNCYANITLAKKGRNFVGRLESAGALTNCLALKASNPTGTTKFTGASGTISNCYILNSVTDTQDGAFAKASAADLLAKLKSVAVWNTSGTLPSLKNVKKADAAAYKPGAVTPPTTSQTTGSDTTSGSADTSTPQQGGEASEGQQSAGIQAVIAQLDDLPDDPEQVTLEHKEAIMKAQKAFDSLTDAEYAEIDPMAIAKMAALREALSLPLQQDVVARIEALPALDKLKYSDKETVLAIQEDVDFLTDTAREAISPALREKLEKSVEKVKKLTPEADTSLTTAEIVWVVVLSVGIVICIGLNVWMCLTIIRRKKQQTPEMQDIFSNNIEE